MSIPKMTTVWLSLDDDENIYIGSPFLADPKELIPLEDIVKETFDDSTTNLKLKKKWKARFEKIVKMMDKDIQKEIKTNGNRNNSKRR